MQRRRPTAELRRAARARHQAPYRGRRMAFYSLVFVGLSQTVGAFALGAAAGAVGVQWAVGASALVTLAFAVYMFARSSDLKAL